MRCQHLKVVNGTQPGSRDIFEKHKIRSFSLGKRKGYGKTKYDNTSRSVRHLGRNFTCRRGMIGELYFSFSDMVQNFDNFPFL